jgi:hypothetical protein
MMRKKKTTKVRKRRKRKKGLPRGGMTILTPV